MITCLLLAAGLSSRFGSPKAIARLNRETVIERLQGLLLATPVHEVIVVLGADAEDIKPFLFKHKKIKVVYNKDYKLGQTSSFKCGLEHISRQATGILLLPVDYAWVKAGTVEQLVTFFEEKRPLILIPGYQNHRGHPPVFDMQLEDEFHLLENSLGINTVIHNHPDEVTVLPFDDDPGVIKTFNTPEEFEQIKAELFL